MSELSPHEFFEVFRARCRYSRTLLELSHRQKELIDRGDYSRLLQVLGRKQRVLGQLDELGKQHPDLARQWQEQRETFETDTRKQCDELLAETERVLAELLEEEKTCTQQLTERRDATQRELQSVSEGAVAHDAYQDSLAPATHRHLNIDQ